MDMLAITKRVGHCLLLILSIWVILGLVDLFIVAPAVNNSCSDQGLYAINSSPSFVAHEKTCDLITTIVNVPW